MPLTDTALRNAKPREKAYKLSDGDGLYIEVMQSGAKYWRMKYRFAGKEKRLAFGVYPEITLKDARLKTADARKLLANDIDPGEVKRAKRLALTDAATNSFEAVALEWLAKQRTAWKTGHKNKVEPRLRRDAFPWIGSKPISSLTAPEILSVLRRVESRGAVETAHRLRQHIGQVMRYAVATGRAERDPSGDLRGALQPVVKKHLAAITEPKAIGALLRAIDSFTGTFVVKSALKLAPLTFVRPGELRQAEWSEIDFESAIWIIPASRTKMGYKTGQDHIVPLSRQALAVLQELHPLTGRNRFVFPGARSNGKPMSDVAVLAALRRMSIGKDEMCGHGFRAMARTVLDEVLGYRVDWIEHQLAHAVKDPNGRAYNRTAHLESRKAMMQGWADYLDRLKVGAVVVELDALRQG